MNNVATLPAAQTNTRLWLAYALVVGLSLTVVPLAWSGKGHSALEVFLALTLIGLCLYPITRYWANQEEGLPTFPIFCLAYAVQFAVPIFTREPTIMLSGVRIVSLGEEEIIASLVLAILGVCALSAGYYGAPYSRLLTVFPKISLPVNQKKAEIFSVLFGLGIPLILRASDYLSEQLISQFSALIRLLQNQTLVAIALLGGIYYLDREKKRTRFLLYVIVIAAVGQGIATGMLENALVPLLALLLIRWHYSRRLPAWSLAAAVLIFVFLSPVKQTYREVVWYGDGNSQPLVSTMDKVGLWFRQATDYWLDTLAGEQTINESTEQAASRLDLVHQLAHIYSRTPSVVPHQYGSTYSFFFVALIPRALWPDKPEAGAANYFYGVNYEITTEEGALRSTFGVGLVGEAFINFGWVGVILIMMLQGVILSLIQFLFGGSESKLGGQAILISFFVYFLNGIGSSAEILFGNIFQNLFFSTILLWYIRERTVLHTPQSSATFSSVVSR